MNYYHLKSRTMAPCSPTQESYQAAKRAWLCDGCALPRVGTGAVDVHLEEVPERLPLNIISGLGVGIARRELLEVMGREIVASNLLLGDVFDASGARLLDYNTFRGKAMAIIRGKETSSYRLCGSCGRHIYFPLGQQYLVEPLASGVDIFESQFNQLIISETVYERIQSIKWRKLTIDKLQVRQQPADSYVCPATMAN